MLKSQTVSIDRVLTDIRAMSLKQAYQAIARQAAADTGLNAAYIYEQFLEQERQATSGIGGGVALPQVRLRTLARPYTMIVRLSSLIDINALDNAPIDLICVLMSPERNVALHLRRLSRLSRLMRDRSLLQGLRSLTEDGVHAAILASQQQLLAA